MMGVWRGEVCEWKWGGGVMGVGRGEVCEGGVMGVGRGGDGCGAGRGV